MSSKHLFIIAILLCAASVSAVVAKPQGMALSIAKDKTICKTVVDYDENENRIPRIIKVLKCAADPYAMCPAGEGRSARCCGAAAGGGAHLACIEVQDSVLVYDVPTSREYTMKVSIGCSCIRREFNQAIE